MIRVLKALCTKVNTSRLSYINLQSLIKNTVKCCRNQKGDN